MKSLIVAVALMATNSLFAQSSGVIWIKSFSPGSADLNDPSLDEAALAQLDSLMKDEDIRVTFLGAADSLSWKMNDQQVHPHISEAWNDAKRLSRARALQERYGRGNVGITYQNIAGVKVLWTKENYEADYTQELEKLKQKSERLSREMASLKNAHGTNGHGKNGKNGTNGHSKVKQESTFNWRLQGGFWTWQSGSNGSLLSPSLALSIIINKTSFIIQGGVTPWHKSTRMGNQSNSFVYAGVKHMKTDFFGITVGGFRGWEFFTDTDNWSFKTTGLAAGAVFAYGRLEVNPSVTFSNTNTLDKENRWQIGSTIGVNFNFN
ncbi:hypothetical protein GWN75_08765 [candidate division KSB1 bacterium]|nr:hypothetical protein [candidate division KSB1 bacterium]NIV68631.1 hypothetical protein [Phycisphaerae bacterium]NIR68424.1 hypothetical protein [candidate division KSB1 bacterium]NIS23973.1 hypothetical protein [candidate division KSB1 bacterium]NIU24623.1 hypothetical protein [candidate division KSB1 bacterium]